MSANENIRSQTTKPGSGKPIILFVGSATFDYWKQGLVDEDGPYRIEHHGIDAAIKFAQTCKSTASDDIVAVVTCMNTSSFNQKTKTVSRKESRGGKAMGIAVYKRISKFFPEAHLFLFTKPNDQPVRRTSSITPLKQSDLQPSQFSSLVIEKLKRE